MKFFRFLILLCSVSPFLLSETPVQAPLSEAQQKLRGELASRLQSSEKKNAGACAEADGWLFLKLEFRILAGGRFWGDEAGKVSQSQDPKLADPIPAIVDFQKQLKARGIDLLLVPVPPKAAIYPEKILPAFDLRTDEPLQFCTALWRLRAAELMFDLFRHDPEEKR